MAQAFKTEWYANKMNRLFYDIECNHEHPQYADMSLCGILEEAPTGDKIHVWEAPFTQDKLDEIEAVLCRPDVERIGFNGLNYDDIVLANYGINIPEENTHDAMIAVKTCYPGMPAYALKFLCWYLLGDAHWEEFELKQTGHRWQDAVTEKLKAYHRKDLQQHRDLWDWIKDKVNEPLHLDAYKLDMAMKLPLVEMTFEGGVYVDVPRCKSTMEELLQKKSTIQTSMQRLTDGKVKNANSNNQVTKYLNQVEDFVFELTATGNFQMKKKDLAELLGMEDEKLRQWQIDDPAPFSSVAMLAWQMRDNETLRKYVAAYLRAAEGTGRDGWIPSAYSISRAGTRRTLSKSYYKINFQNSTEAIDEFKLVPPGYVGWFIDSTQVENVVHIYESGDIARRLSYESDPEWNEYVWLCNRILGTNKDKKELDSIKSKQIPHWSVYKLYKTVKLALNFGMGIKKFCSTLGIDYKTGKMIFGDIHSACPAIRLLQEKVETALINNGFVQDTFGHIYTGYEDEAYKLVAFLIQGCGTGSLPKAQLRANYDTLHRWSGDMGVAVGPLSNTTHDECGGFLRLDLGEEVLTCILQELMENMTTKFSHKFDGIPLRAKLYLSTKNTHDKKLHEQPNWRDHIEFLR